jgi:alkylhydroperoxidase family enzyme
VPRATVATSHEALGSAIESAKEHFDDAEMSKLTYLIVVINAWNRLGIAAAGRVGGYIPGAR